MGKDRGVIPSHYGLEWSIQQKEHLQQNVFIITITSAELVSKCRISSWPESALFCTINYVAERSTKILYI
jgi:hypothetical protein